MGENLSSCQEQDGAACQEQNAVTRVELVPSPELLEQLYAVEASAHPDPWSIDQIAGCFAEGCDVVALYERGALAGFAVTRAAAGEAELYTIGIMKERQGRGLGKILLAAAMDACRRRGAECCFLEVREHNAPALALYKGYGFEMIGMRKNYYRALPGIPAENAISMRCAL